MSQSIGTFIRNHMLDRHWEGNLIIGKNHKSAIETIIGRKSRYTLIVKLKDINAA